MPANKPEIRALRPSDMDSFVELCMHRDGMDRAAAEHRAQVVEWIAFHNPDDDGDPTYFVADVGGRVMGHLGRMPTRFYVEGEPHLASYVHDLFVHPELQKGGRGLFLSMQLYRTAERASKSFCVLVWTNEINIRIQQARGYDQLWAERYVKLLRADGQIDRLAGRVREGLPRPLPRPLIEPLAALAKPVATGVIQASDRLLYRTTHARHRLVRIEGFDARFDRLAERVGPRMGIAPIKTQRYLRWKHADRPALETATYAALDTGGELAGFVVVCVPRTAYHDSYILELVADPDDARTIAALCHQAIEHCREQGAYSLQCIGTDPRFARVLRQLLFVPREPREPLFRANAGRYAHPEVLGRLGAWHASYGDSEGPI